MYCTDDQCTYSLSRLLHNILSLLMSINAWLKPNHPYLLSCLLPSLWWLLPALITLTRSNHLDYIISTSPFLSFHCQLGCSTSPRTSFSPPLLFSSLLSPSLTLRVQHIPRAPASGPHPREVPGLPLLSRTCRHISVRRWCYKPYLALSYPPMIFLTCCSLEKAAR